MASPQTENGHTKIANEILEQLVKAGLLGSEWSIAVWILRKTYGYQKKEDWISLTQFEKATSLSRPTVVKTLKNLVTRGILQKDSECNYRFVKDWEKWVVKAGLLVKSRHEFGKGGLTDTGKGGLTHKRNYQKKTKDIISLSAKGAIMFNSKEYIKGLINSKSRINHIIGIYYNFREESWPGKDAVEYLMGKERRPAKGLKDYTDEQIIKTMEYLNGRVRQNKLEKWTLATVINYIGEITNGKV